ncbi:SDR family NAD(P)-dependent oxidoreductase [Tepidiforma thermophila]|uniref:NAD(P)-dependent dehydrogenase (Short-subunit alcohol dehydrogenase family) n=1 Tax=Tepidiforma thermophila (strain KCTC 52669 / CGMCC 1.13589 / G233) TaxID=2761530 RepID=A0A2A9HHI9_TEPT2|nr:SDR family oxidoreductase [Tepidiforma thermophila]PFG74279.1 NAD(P)-dependent dehydrogenase (short-subunit alcohol dehydrogenase family) [Tepidiforma thermophila]
MAGRLNGRVAIVTGAGSQTEGIGNGRATAVLFAREGARVLLVDRRLEAAELTARLIAEEHGEAEPFAADVTSEAACRAMVERALGRWGRLDILVNNVGIGIAKRITEVTLEEWELQMRVNVTSMALASKHAIPAMLATAGGGAIVNISSIASQRGRGLAPYAASKGAVEALTRAMAADHGRDGIRVNAIAPGPAYTPMVSARGMPESVREARRKSTALGIEGTAWDIAWAAVYLASDEARWVTGVVLPVDGGVLVN